MSILDRPIALNQKRNRKPSSKPMVSRSPEKSVSPNRLTIRLPLPPYRRRHPQHKAPESARQLERHLGRTMRLSEDEDEAAGGKKKRKAASVTSTTGEAVAADEDESGDK
ncbi:hypothetical protein GJ744_008872 [Endocarpon pusillum]|uniref:Uncharacterized protein n=1 Tax=Endocarpon pusillum TaxID=364733 RepID=A0A8H7AQN4_9EURO|nr:hypothetical protein GJ744_008872 [Endocarpon pusillum]